MTGRTEQLREDFELAVRLRPFPLHPETPTQGRSLEDLFSNTTVDVPAMLVQLEQIARRLNLPFGTRINTYNSRLAQELGLWAETKGAADAFHREAFLAYFRDGLNLALPEVLLKIVDRAGLPLDEARSSLEQRHFMEAVDREWSAARALGITAVPTLLFKGRSLVGFQPYGRLEELITAGGGKRHHAS